MTQGMMANDPTKMVLAAQQEHESQVAAVVAVIRPIFNDVIIRTLESAQPKAPAATPSILSGTVSAVETGSVKTKQMEVAGQPISQALDLSKLNIPPASLPSLLKEAVDQLNAGVHTLKVNFTESNGQYLIGAAPSPTATAGAQADIKVSLTADQFNKTPLAHLEDYAKGMRERIQSKQSTPEEEMEKASHHVLDLATGSNLSDEQASAYAKEALQALQEVADGKRRPADARLIAAQDGDHIKIELAKENTPTAKAPAVHKTAPHRAAPPHWQTAISDIEKSAEMNWQEKVRRLQEMKPPAHITAEERKAFQSDRNKAVHDQQAYGQAEPSVHALAAGLSQLPADAALKSSPPFQTLLAAARQNPKTLTRAVELSSEMTAVQKISTLTALQEADSTHRAVYKAAIAGQRTYLNAVGADSQRFEQSRLPTIKSFYAAHAYPLDKLSMESSQIISQIRNDSGFVTATASTTAVAKPKVLRGFSEFTPANIERELAGLTDPLERNRYLHNLNSSFAAAEMTVRVNRANDYLSGKAVLAADQPQEVQLNLATYLVGVIASADALSHQNTDPKVLAVLAQMRKEAKDLLANGLPASQGRPSEKTFERIKDLNEDFSHVLEDQYWNNYKPTIMGESIDNPMAGALVKFFDQHSGAFETGGLIALTIVAPEVGVGVIAGIGAGQITEGIATRSTKKIILGSLMMVPLAGELTGALAPAASGLAMASEVAEGVMVAGMTGEVVRGAVQTIREASRTYPTMANWVDLGFDVALVGLGTKAVKETAGRIRADFSSSHEIAEAPVRPELSQTVVTPEGRLAGEGGPSSMTVDAQGRLIAKPSPDAPSMAEVAGVAEGEAILARSVRSPGRSVRAKAEVEGEGAAEAEASAHPHAAENREVRPAEQAEQTEFETAKAELRAAVVKAADVFKGESLVSPSAALVAMSAYLTAIDASENYSELIAPTVTVYNALVQTAPNLSEADKSSSLSMMDAENSLRKHFLTSEIESTYKPQVYAIKNLSKILLDKIS